MNEVKKMGNQEKIFSKIIKKYFNLKNNGMSPISDGKLGINTLVMKKGKILNNNQLIISHNKYEENNIDRYYVSYGTVSLSFDKNDILYGDLDFKETLIESISLEGQIMEDKKINQLITEFKALSKKLEEELKNKNEIERNIELS